LREAQHGQSDQGEDYFVDPGHITHKPWGPCHGTEVPNIGFDFVELDRKRFDDARCHSMNTIRFFNCVVDAAAWSEFVKASKCENKWLFTDPKTLETAKPLSEVFAADVAEEK
jgi:hypothetical protein